MIATEISEVKFYCPCCKVWVKREPQQELIYGAEVCSECYSLMYDKGNSTNWQADC